MKTAKIPKGNGTFRTIYCPSNKEKAMYRFHLSDVSRRVENLPTVDCIHGFRRGKSPVTMAQAHIGHAWTITMDLKNFFPSCTKDRLKGKIKGKILNKLLVDDHAAQGLPTSPSLANLAASDMDKAILRFIEHKNKQCVYTRYADDLAISGDNPEIINTIINEIHNIAKKCGFTVHPNKTHIYYACQGRRIICGVSVGETDIQPTRKTKRKIRAAKHQTKLKIQGAKESLKGLQEWSKLKIPYQSGQTSEIISKTPENLIDEVLKVAKVWRLNNINANKLRNTGEMIKIGENSYITDDPVLMLGMSTYTTGWTSCMRHPGGQYRRGTIFWTHLRGTRIAVVFDKNKGVHGGVERPLMGARTLIHKLRDNDVLVYDRIYGAPDQIEILEKNLRNHGVISVVQAKKKYPNIKVVGHAPAKWATYCDNMKTSTAKASNGIWKGSKVRIVHL